MTDIQRLQLKYERGLRCIYNGVSLRGVIIGIKKKSGNQEKEKEPYDTKSHKLLSNAQHLNEPETDISNSGFADYGYDEVNYEYHTEQLQKELREKNKQYTELQIEHDQLKADFEELKKKMEAMATKPVKSVIGDSDDEVVEETKTAKSKKHKIIKAIECDE
jgi:hypothetical protein